MVANVNTIILDIKVYVVFPSSLCSSWVSAMRTLIASDGEESLSIGKERGTFMYMYVEEYILQ